VAILYRPVILMMNNNMPEEVLDLVNENDEVIGALSREEIYKQKLHNYRAVHGFVVNGEGKIWLPRRAANKKLYPSALDYSLAGHVESGESYNESFLREVFEELNITPEEMQWKQLGKLTPTDGVHCFMMFYEIKTNETPDYNDEDFSEGLWLSPEDAVEMIEKEGRSKDELTAMIRKFYFHD